MSYEGAAEAVTFLGLGLFLWAGAQQVLAGQLTIGGLVAFNSLVTLATAPIHNLLSLWDTLQRATVMLNRLDDVFEQEPEQGTIARGSVRCAASTGHVSFRRRRLPLRRPGGAGDPAGHHARGAGREDRRHRRPQRLGQDHAGQVPGRPARADRRHDPVRRARSEDAQLPRPAPPDRASCCRTSTCSPTPSRRNIAFGEDEPDMDARDVGGAGRERPRVHRPAAVRLRHTHRRNRHRALGRPEAADRHRPRHLSQAADSGLRRSDQLARHGIGARGPGKHRRAAARAARRSSSRTA